MESDESPPKKARFLWEVKGNHHMKEGIRDGISENGNNNDPETSTSSSASIEAINSATTSTGNEMSLHRTCCIENYLKSTEAIWDECDSDIDYLTEESRNFVFENVDRAEYYMEKWHRKREARAYLDNTINLVLERYMGQPGEQYEAASIEEDAISCAIETHGLQQQTLPRNSNSANFIANMSYENDIMHQAVGCAILEKGLTYGLQI